MPRNLAKQEELEWEQRQFAKRGQPKADRSAGSLSNQSKVSDRSFPQLQGLLHSLLAEKPQCRLNFEEISVRHWRISKRMSNFVRLRSNIEICLIRRSESGISSQNSREHSTTSSKMMVPRDLLNKSTKKQRKVSQLDPLTIFRALTLRKEWDREISEFFLGIQAFALTRMGGACALRIVS